MGSTIFKGKLGKKGLVKGATYKVGSLGYDPKMANELVDRFFEQHTFVSAEAFSSHVEEECSPQLRTHPDLNIDSFIDAIIRRLEEGSDFLHARYAGAVLNPLVALMYELGYKHISLDLRGVNGMQQKIVNDIAATDEQPFSIVLRLAKYSMGLDACYAASHLSHCNIRLFGSAETVGDNGSHSDYTLEDKVLQAGDSASDCVFRFPHVKDVLLTNERDPVYADRHRFKMITEDSYFELSVENSFFIHKNKLLIPDGAGWKEVTPE